MSTPASSILRSSPSRLRRWLRRGRRLALLLLAAWLGRWVYLHLTLKPTPRPEYWAAQIAALDPPPKGAVDLDRLRELESVFVEFDADPTLPEVGYTHSADVVLMGSWDATRADIAAVARILESAKFERARKEFIAATRAGWYVPPNLSTGMPGMKFSDVRKLARWLAAHSRWALREQGRVDLALEDWLTLVRLARELSRPQTSMDAMNAALVESSVAAEMILTAVDERPQVDSLSIAIEIDGILGPARSAEYCIQGQRLHELHLIETWYVREGGNWLALSEWVGRTSRFGPASSGWNLASPVFYSISDARANVERHSKTHVAFDNLVRCMDDVPPAGTPRVEPLSVLAGWPRLTTAQFNYGVGRALASRGALDAAVTILALNEFRRSMGRYPDRLDELMPVYLPRLPIDYADRQPLRYRPTPDGYLLYSIGIDGVDNGGRPPRESPEYYHGRDRKGTDMVFNLRTRGPVPK